MNEATEEPAEELERVLRNLIATGRGKQLVELPVLTPGVPIEAIAIRVRHLQRLQQIFGTNQKVAMVSTHLVDQASFRRAIEGFGLYLPQQFEPSPTYTKFPCYACAHETWIGPKQLNLLMHETFPDNLPFKPEHGPYVICMLCTTIVALTGGRLPREMMLIPLTAGAAAQGPLAGVPEPPMNPL